jgi:hypothetical protein
MTKSQVGYVVRKSLKSPPPDKMEPYIERMVEMYGLVELREYIWPGEGYFRTIPPEHRYPGSPRLGWLTKEEAIVIKELTIKAHGPEWDFEVVKITVIEEEIEQCHSTGKPTNEI